MEAGTLADFVLLEGNPIGDIRNTTRIRAVVTNGRHLDRKELDALIGTVRPRHAGEGRSVAAV